MAAVEYFGRAYRLTLSSPRYGTRVWVTKKDEPALDIKFHLKFAKDQYSMEGTVEILGLSWKSIVEIIATSAEARGDALAMQLRCKLEVGYFTNTGVIEVIDGYVYFASVSSPPNMWLKMEVTEYNEYAAKYVSFDKDFEPMPIRDLLTTIFGKFAEKENVQIKLLDKTQEKLLDKQEPVKLSLHGDAYVLKRMIVYLSGELSDKIWFAMRTYASDDGIRIIEAYDKDLSKGVGTPVPLDLDHGLLSVSGLSVKNATVTTFIDARCDNQISHAILKSQLAPQANGRYLVTQKEYVGHFAGKEWYVRYFCTDAQR